MKYYDPMPRLKGKNKGLWFYGVAKNHTAPMREYGPFKTEKEARDHRLAQTRGEHYEEI